MINFFLDIAYGAVLMIAILAGALAIVAFLAYTPVELIFGIIALGFCWIGGNAMRSR